MISDRDTIFALSSGRPPAAIAVVRVSGPRARGALEQRNLAVAGTRWGRSTALKKPNDATLRGAKLQSLRRPQPCVWVRDGGKRHDLICCRVRFAKSSGAVKEWPRCQKLLNAFAAIKREAILVTLKK